MGKANNTIKQRRLSDQLNNLADRLSLLSRYYIRENSNPLNPSSANLFGSQSNDDLAAEILKESSLPVTLLSLNPTALAIELTLSDFSVFRSIEPQSYIFDLFNMKIDDTEINDKCLKEFEQFESLSNREMFWVINEILDDRILRRVKKIKYFIKVAAICRHLHNYNSLFAILSGLGHGSIQRLKITWDKISLKYQRIYENLLILLDPSRNMSNYRREITLCAAPIIPFFPIIKKDLTFLHLANETFDHENRVNFDKMRMISKEIRNLSQMSSGSYPTSNTCNGFLSSLNRREIEFDVIGAVPLPPPPPTSSSSNSAVAKRFYEEFSARKRVKFYLSSIFENVDCDEDRLLAKSFELEVGTVNTPKQVKQENSPNLSIHSGGNGGMKFGVESPQQLRKLLSLSEFECKPQKPGKVTNNNLTDNVRSVTVVDSAAASFTAPAPPRKVVLPVESSSVTSFRSFHTENQNFFSNFTRPALPNYDETLKRKGKFNEFSHRSSGSSLSSWSSGVVTGLSPVSSMSSLNSVGNLSNQNRTGNFTANGGHDEKVSFV